MNIIGISGLHHSVPFKKRELPNLSEQQYRIAQGFDSAAALVASDGIKAVAAEERFTREKATGSFPVNAIKYCLNEANLHHANIDCVAHSFSYEPYRSFFDDLDGFYRKQFSEVYSLEAQRKCITNHLPTYNWADKLIPVPHHMAHAASTFYLSGFSHALVVVADGMGEMHSTSIAVGTKNQIEIIKEIPALHSLGILYGVLTLYLGFHMALDEYKVMGLAPYGNPRRYFNQFMEYIHFKNDGTFTIPFLARDITLEEKETHNGVIQILKDTLGPPRNPNEEITQHHMDIAAALQSALQATLMHVLYHFKKHTAQTNLCMAGGVALNCTANGVINRSRMFKKIFVQPAAGDDGSALGAALYVQRQYEPNIRMKRMTLPLWGPRHSNDDIEGALRQYPMCEYMFFHSFDSLTQNVAKRIAQGQIVAWFQGRMEFGPRALGNRSILADPRDPGMRDRINSLVKKREKFRPFAPAVTAERAYEFFEIEKGDESTYAHMLLATNVREARREKLPAITHVDGSARVQTVSRDHIPRFWTLINEFGRLTGIPVLLNTSFNVRGQPMVCTPRDALETFLFAKLDVLVIEDYVVVRRNYMEVDTTKKIDQVAENTAGVILSES